MKINAVAIAAVFTLTLTACASVTSMDLGGRIAPEQAIQMAASAAPALVPGVFDMRVQATGTQNGYVYLNSELDYRDQRNLTISMTPDAVKRFISDTGTSPLEAFKGKHIVVRGAASRVKIVFSVDQRQTDKYYYQTQVAVLGGDQISILN